MSAETLDNHCPSPHFCTVRKIWTSSAPEPPFSILALNIIECKFSWNGLPRSVKSRKFASPDSGWIASFNFPKSGAIELFVLAALITSDCDSSLTMLP